MVVQIDPSNGKFVTKALPKDAQVMIAIMNDMGIHDFEPRVVNQLLEFSYRYISTMLEDAKIYAAHARKNTVDLDDIRIAVQMHADHSLTSPPPRDLLVEVAAKRNAIPLPIPKQCGGLSLPPERFCLTATNYRLKSINSKPSLPVSVRVDNPPKTQNISTHYNNAKSYQFTPKYELNAAGKVVLRNAPSFAAANLSNKSIKPVLGNTNNVPPASVIKINSQSIAASVAESKQPNESKPNQAAATIQIETTTSATGAPIFSMTVDPSMLESPSTSQGSTTSNTQGNLEKTNQANSTSNQKAAEKKNLKRRREELINSLDF